MKVLFHGRLAEAIGPELDIAAAPGCSVADLRERVVAQYPGVEDVLRSRRARTCIGDAFVGDDRLLEAGDTLEFLPPVSGG